MTKLKEDFEASGGVWKEWRIGDLFEKKTIKGCPKSKENLNINDSGYYMYGQNIKRQYPYKILLDDIYLQKVSEQYPILAYTSSVGEIGMICENFYRSGDNGAFQGLFPKTKDFSINILSFVLSVLKLQFSTFGYATGMANIINLTFYLPTLNNSLALDYMEQYISMLEEEKMLQVDKFLKDSGLNDTTLTAEETAALEKFRNGEVLFEERKIGDLFEIKKGKRLTKENIKPGKTNFLGAISDNNGIRETIDAPFTWAPNCISVNYNGSVGCSYYQEQEFFASDDVNLCYAKDWPLDKYIALYFCAVFFKYSDMFNFGFKWSKDKMEESLVKVPVTLSNIPDFGFMQHIISALEKLVIRGVVKYKDEVLNADG
ncbi:MAG: restriction endonuclease subunit S, partial [Bacteroidales bacterium]|nr:restriction endonuclease subunit S [Bacteroidales bacterium]